VIQKLDLGNEPRPVFAEPTPLGLLGLAIGCAALVPIAFGAQVGPVGLRTAAILCLLFGGGCQLLSGLMNFANKNLYGGTLLTAFSFNWLLNWWVLDGLAEGRLVDPATLLCTDSAFLIIFLVFTYGFGFFSKLLFVFLLDIDLLFACKVLDGATGAHALGLPVAILTVLLGLLSLWIAFALLINKVAGRTVFAMPGPLFAARKAAGFDLSSRRAVFEILYKHFKEHAFEELSFEELSVRVRERLGEWNVVPDLYYLHELGALALKPEPGDPNRPKSLRLTARGIDLYEQAALGKFRE
jgi:hypothetical protein